jgi:hypothetical protein
LQRDEDSFLDPTEGQPEELGLKSAARRLIRDLPPEGHAAYELLHGTTARRLLNAALEAGNQDRIAAVVRQYFHTWAGYEAALILAQMESDQGHHLAAAQLYQELIDTPRAAERLEPHLSLRAALNQVAASHSDLAVNILRSLIEKHPSATINLTGRGTSVPRADADLLDWLFRAVGKPAKTAVIRSGTRAGHTVGRICDHDGRPAL